MTTPNRAAAQQDTVFAKPIGYVSDYDHIFTKAQIDTLESMSTMISKKNDCRIAIVTLEPATVTGDFNVYSISLFNRLGVGEKGKNNGILISFSTGLRKARITTGLGMESRLTNAEAQIIISELIIPNFKNGRYFEGTIQALKAIEKYVVR